MNDAKSDLPKGRPAKQVKSTAKGGFMKRFWWIFVILAVCIWLFIMWSLFIKGDDQANVLEEADLQDMTISDACQKTKDLGWTPYVTIWSSSSDYRSGDCLNTALKVARFTYDDGYCWGHSQSNSTEHNVCIEAYDNGYDGSSSSSNESTQNEAATQNSASPDNNSTDMSATTSAPDTSTDGTSSDSATFRSVMDGYEQYMNKYVDFMKKYEANPSDASLLSDYASMISQYTDWMDKIDDYNEDNLSISDWQYYIDVTSRVNKKLSEV